MKELGKYLLVGIINTGVGFGTIFLLVFLGILPEIANLLGYIAGVLCSYIFNKTFTFQSKKKGDFLPFVLSMGVAYIFNLLTFVLFFRGMAINVYTSQILAGAVYTLSGFILSKFFVWKNSS